MNKDLEHIHDKLKEKIKDKSYTEKRFEKIVNECSINKVLEESYKLGLASACGSIMYMIDQDFDKKDIRKFIMSGLILDEDQFKSDVFGVWGEMYKNIK